MSTINKQDDTHTYYDQDTGTSANAYAEASKFETGRGAGTITVVNSGGANGMTVKFTNNLDKIIQYNGADETALAHSSDMILDILSNATGITEVKVNIKSTGAGSHTTYTSDSTWRR